MDWHTLKTRLLSFLNLSKGCTASEIQISTGCHGNQNLKLDFLANYNVFGIIIFSTGSYIQSASFPDSTGKRKIWYNMKNKEKQNAQYMYVHIVHVHRRVQEDRVCRTQYCDYFETSFESLYTILSDHNRTGCGMQVLYIAEYYVWSKNISDRSIQKWCTLYRYEAEHTAAFIHCIVIIWVAE